MPESQNPFLKVKCADCENEQVIFSRPAMRIACSVCGSTLAEATGGRANVKGEVVAEFT